MSLRDWLVAGAILVAVLTLVPMNWPRLESLPAGPNARIPYERGNDYWLFDQFSRQEAAAGKVLLVGDSVVWGHYVSSDEALSGQLNRRAGANRFANLGVDGIHPMAMEGLIRYYGPGIEGRSVMLHCNLLWMSSPRHDLRERKAFAFNHPRLVPQLVPWIECYDEGVAGRLAVAVGRELPSSRLAYHWQTACFGGKDIPSWTLDHPYENPLARIARPPAVGGSSGPAPGATQETWEQRQLGPMAAQWVNLDESFQWAAFQRAAGLLRGRGNRLFVVVGPFNEHMLTGAALEAYRRQVAGVEAWLAREGIPHWVAPALPRQEYADASHPLAAGYDRMALQLLSDKSFAAFASVEPLRPPEGNSR